MFCISRKIIVGLSMVVCASASLRQSGGRAGPAATGGAAPMVKFEAHEYTLRYDCFDEKHFHYSIADENAHPMLQGENLKLTFKQWIKVVDRMDDLFNHTKMGEHLSDLLQKQIKKARKNLKSCVAKFQEPIDTKSVDKRLDRLTKWYELIYKSQFNPKKINRVWFNFVKETCRVARVVFQERFVVIKPSQSFAADDSDFSHGAAVDTKAEAPARPTSTRADEIAWARSCDDRSNGKKFSVVVRRGFQSKKDKSTRMYTITDANAINLNDSCSEHQFHRLD